MMMFEAIIVELK